MSAWFCEGRSQVVPDFDVVCYTDGSFLSVDGQQHLGWACAFFRRDCPDASVTGGCCGVISGGLPS